MLRWHNAVTVSGSVVTTVAPATVVAGTVLVINNAHSRRSSVSSRRAKRFPFSLLLTANTLNAGVPSVFARATGAGVNLYEIQPGVLYNEEGPSALDIRNDSGGALTFMVSEYSCMRKYLSAYRGARHRAVHGGDDWRLSIAAHLSGSHGRAAAPSRSVHECGPRTGCRTRRLYSTRSIKRPHAACGARLRKAAAIFSISVMTPAAHARGSRAPVAPQRRLNARHWQRD